MSRVVIEKTNGKISSKLLEGIMSNFGFEGPTEGVYSFRSKDKSHYYTVVVNGNSIILETNLSL